MTGFDQRRDAMVERQIAAGGIHDSRLLDAFRTVPREMFVDPAQAANAYDDRPLPIGHGQTISQPYIVALTIAAAAIGPGDKVLEVGAGSGYAAAVIGRIARQVFAIERLSELTALASERMERLGYGNVRIVEGDGSLGLPDEAPFDAILCAAAGPSVPESWKRQLAPGGRIVMPVGAQHGAQRLVRWTAGESGAGRLDELDHVRFVPLIGAEGY